MTLRINVLVSMLAPKSIVIAAKLGDMNVKKGKITNKT